MGTELGNYGILLPKTDLFNSGLERQRYASERYDIPRNHTKGHQQLQFEVARASCACLHGRDARATFKLHQYQELEVEHGQNSLLSSVWSGKDPRAVYVDTEIRRHSRLRGRHQGFDNLSGLSRAGKVFRLAALLIAFDPALFHPDWSGTMEYRFRTTEAEVFVEKLRERIG
jgi:hypothetical protein